MLKGYGLRDIEGGIERVWVEGIGLRDRIWGKTVCGSGFVRLGSKSWGYWG